MTIFSDDSKKVEESFHNLNPKQLRDEVLSPHQTRFGLEKKPIKITMTGE